MRASLRAGVVAWSSVLFAVTSCGSSVDPASPVTTESPVYGTTDTSWVTNNCTGLRDGTPCHDGNLCTQNDFCFRGVCRAGTPITCPAPTDQCHTTGTCNPSTGVCSTPAKANGTTCSDGNSCTRKDTCQAGVCTGSDPVTCAAQDQCHVAGTCDPTSGACSNPVADDGTSCNDGNACTQMDSCQAGTCVGSAPVVCAPTDQCHTAGVCDPATGVCAAAQALADGTPCNDGNACTQTDVCQAGACVGLAAVTCAGADQCHTAGVCDPSTGACSGPVAVANGTSCNDGNACTQMDVCQAGACVGTMPVTCTAQDQCHDAGTCDPTSGACTNPPKENGTACSDGNACTQHDVCQAGACTGGDPVTCVAQDQCHDAGTCNPANGMCTNPAKADGTDCNDGSACTQRDVCAAGVCTGTMPVVCAASDQCHDAGTCNPANGTCTNPAKADGTDCNDGSACTQKDVCQAGTCTGTMPVVCTASDQCHDAGTCDPASGACTNPAKADGTDCNDGNACTQKDVCAAGTCTGTMPVVCAAADQCHDAGTCDPASGVCSNPAKADGTTCSDGNACTQKDVCQAGTCTGTMPVVCTAQDQCHDTGTCDPASGACTNPAKADGTTCNDGNACTQKDVCAAGACTGTMPVVCTAQDQCHDAGTCDPANGLCSNPTKADGTTCSDGNACTQKDVCQAGTCTGTMPVVCTAQDQCHDAGTCDPMNGACSNPNKADGTGCSDGDFCTQTDACQAGKCVGMNPVICVAADQCHEVGICRPATGKCTSPEKADGTACNDSDACTQTDVCQTGVCTGTNPVLCAALDQCHDVGICNPASGTCSTPNKAEETPCSDGDACTQRDVCRAGACLGTTPVVCTAQDQCHAAGTCDSSTGACSNPTAPDGTACDDANACTQRDSCSLGRCVGSNPVLCTAQDQCHAVGTCNPSTGACSNPALADNTACDDGNACTQKDVCQTGTCTGTTPVVCTAQDSCHVPGSCNPSTGACSNPNAADGTTCDDRNLCTRTDACQSGVCTGTNPVVCDPPDQCHLPGTCAPNTGTCPLVNKPDQAPCDDGNACTISDNCRAGVCAAGVNKCVMLTVGNTPPTVNQRLGQMTETLSANVTTGIPGTPITFTAALTNSGLFFIMNGDGRISLTNTNKETPFTVLGYRMSLESLSPSGAWTVVASFERDDLGNLLTPATPVVQLKTFGTHLPSPLPTGVTHPSNAVDPVFATQLAPNASVTWTYDVSVILPAAATRALLQGTTGMRLQMRFNTTVSPVPVDALGIGDITQAFANFDGVIVNPTVQLKYFDVGVSTTASAPAGTALHPGDTFQFVVPFFMPPVPQRGQPPAAATETEASYIGRLNTIVSLGYDLRALGNATLPNGTLQQVSATLGLPFRGQLPVLAVSTSGASSLNAGLPAVVTIAVSNSGTAAAKTVTLVDALGGTIASQIPLPLPALNNGKPGAGTAILTLPASVVQPGTLSDRVTVTWTDPNDNPYGTNSAAYTATVVAGTLMAPVAFEDPAQGVAGADLLRTMTFGKAGIASTAVGAGLGPVGLGPVSRPFAPVVPAQSGAAAAKRPGHLLVSASDVTVWLAGVPVRIGRRYDSTALDQVGDFGHGWSLDIAPRLEMDGAHDVAMQLGDGRRLPFSLAFAPYSSVVRSLVKPVYAPGAGATGTLTSDGCSLVTFDGDHALCFMGGGAEYLPATYAFTDPEGRVLALDAGGRLRSIQDSAGSALTLDANGIALGATRAVTFERDGEGRIARIVVAAALDGSAPAQEYRYDYDEAGDLRLVTSPDGTRSMAYTYDGSHRLSTLADPGEGVRIAGQEGAFEQQLGAALSCGPDAGALEMSLVDGPLGAAAPGPATGGLCR